MLDRVPLRSRVKAEANLAALIESTKDLIWAVDLGYRLVAFNGAMAENIETNFGISVKLGMLPEELLPPERARFWRPMYDRALREGSFVVEYGLVDGRTLELTFNPILHDGNGAGVSVFGKDITGWKAAANALRESEQRFRGIFDSAYELMGLLSPSGTLLEVNQTALTMVGARREDVIGKSFWDTPWWSRSALSQQKLMEMIARAARGEAQCGEADHIASDGSVRHIEFTLKPVLDKNGAVKMVVPEGRDVTALKHSRASLLESEARFRKVFDLVPYSMAIHDREGRILDANARLCNVCGRTCEELQGHFLTDFLELRCPGFRELPPELDRRVLREAQQGPLELTVIHHPSGRRAIVLLSAAAIFLEGQPCQVTSATNITELRDMEQQFRQAQKMEAIGRLAGGVAHDFNNLLTVVNGYCDIVLQRLQPYDPLRKPILEIRKAGERATGLSRQLLTFSRKQVVKPRPVNLVQLIQESRGMLERLVGEDVEIKAYLDAAAGLVMADPGQLDQVLMNLAVNARDAMPQGGCLGLQVSQVHVDRETALSLSGTAPGLYVVLEVSDTGVGMNEEVQQRLFEPFFTTKGEGAGTGLGLATVYGIVRHAEGWIQVASQPGAGTVFRIGLPILHELPSEERPRQEPQEALGGCETILVVEDQDEVRTVVLAALQSFGYLTLEAQSAAEALVIIGNYVGTIDLVLTDVVMPGMNGKQLATRLQALRPGMKALLMSGYTGEVILSRGLLDPETEYLQKPFTPEALARSVRKALASARSGGKVLVVDDDEGIRSFFAKVLEDGGYQVIAVCDGAEAQTRLETDSFDLVIMDLVMPNAEGIETIRAIRQTRPGLRLIAVSGAFDGTFLKAAALLGANATLQKPVSPDLLLATVRDLLT